MVVRCPRIEIPAPARPETSRGMLNAGLKFEQCGIDAGLSTDRNTNTAADVETGPKAILSAQFIEVALRWPTSFTYRLIAF